MTLYNFDKQIFYRQSLLLCSIENIQAYTAIIILAKFIVFHFSSDSNIYIYSTCHRTVFTSESPHYMSPAVCSHCSPGMSSYTTSPSPSVPPPPDTAAGCWGAGGDRTSYVPSPTRGPPGGLTSSYSCPLSCPPL